MRPPQASSAGWQVQALAVRRAGVLLSHATMARTCGPCLMVVHIVNKETSHGVANMKGLTKLR